MIFQIPINFLAQIQNVQEHVMKYKDINAFLSIH